MFAREGYPFILGAAAFAAIAFAMAVRLRSWPLWLVAIVLTLVALCVAWFFRNPTRVGERAASVVIAPVSRKLVRSTNIDEPAFVRELIRFGPRVERFLSPKPRVRATSGERTVAREMVLADLPIS